MYFRRHVVGGSNLRWGIRKWRTLRSKSSQERLRVCCDPSDIPQHDHVARVPVKAIFWVAEKPKRFREDLQYRTISKYLLRSSQRITSRVTKAGTCTFDTTQGHRAVVPGQHQNGGSKPSLCSKCCIFGEYPALRNFSTSGSGNQRMKQMKSMAFQTSILACADQRPTPHAEPNRRASNSTADEPF